MITTDPVTLKTSAVAAIDSGTTGHYFEPTKENLTEIKENSPGEEI